MGFRMKHMPEVMDEVQEFESNTVGIYRTAATVKGGRRFSLGGGG
jgi:hypothetical protein